MRSLVLHTAAAALTLSGCAPQSKVPPKRDDVTSGHITIVSSPEALGEVEGCTREFQRLYPDAHITVTAGSSRNAVAALFGARADMAVITREIVPEERRAAVDGRLEIESFRFARDAAVMIVNAANPLDQITIDDVRRIYHGEVTRWDELGGRAGAIEPVIQPVDADLTEFFVEEVLAGGAVSARSLGGTDDADVVRTVLSHPGAIGYVTMAGANAAAGQSVKPLKLAALKGLPYYAPDLEMVHDGKYPVTRTA